ncbi:MAG: DUF1549 domain-containing protein [Pirellulaceae bacterium]
MMLRLLLLLSMLACAPAMVIGDDLIFSDGDLQYFERKIRPILVEHCYACHSSQAEVLHGGLQFDDHRWRTEGSDSGLTVIAGQPAASLLVESIEYTGDLQMPPKSKLPEAEIRELTEWVRRGAPFPQTHATANPRAEVDYEEGRKFWSFQPARLQPLPKVARAHWPQTRGDYFVLAGIERAGLQPAAPADRATLIRRLSHNLTGLPPSPEDVRSFVQDGSAVAYERLLDRWLASPQYGEKWGRMWLDLARYTDQTESWLLQEGQSHFYRDWVVEAFNKDLPYDTFIQQQLAGDLLPDARPADLAALGFVGLSPTYWKELKLPCEVIKVIVADEWEERVDAVSSTFLGLTVACARCHDHKFDPISSADYYALAGVFASSRQIGRPLIAEELYEPVREAKAELAQLEPKLPKLNAEVTRLKKELEQVVAPENSEAEGDEKTDKIKPAEALRAELMQAEVKLAEVNERIATLKATPLFDTPLTNALSEESLYVERAGEKPQDGTRLVYRPGPQNLPLFSRGDPNRPGEIVPRGFLTVLSSTPRLFTQGSGRLELAQAITNEAASLAARVLVNRVWLAHFGQGIVGTPSNFGTQGSPPTHPQLLDDLTARFMVNGWSIKWLQREILLSATWQQAVEPSPAARASDPGNRWLSHMNRRRHDFEAWRDTMLSASGALDLAIGGVAVNLDEVGNRRRTLYCLVHRRELSTTYQIHDFPDPNQHSPQRFTTTTPLQGLYALNGPLLAEQSQLLVERLQREYPHDDATRIDRAHWLLYSRAATDDERQLGLSYLSDSQGQARLDRWKQYAHALLASNETLFLD